MERPIVKPIGTPVLQLDTPALVVDLDALEHNLETVHSFFRRSDAKVRPHVASHLCPALASLQVESGGTVGGISVASVGQAEVFAQQGFADITVTKESVTRQKIERACEVARSVKVTLAADSTANVQDLSEAAQTHGVTLRVLVNIHAGMEGSGVEPGQPAVDLAREVQSAGGLQFAGVMSYEGAILAEDITELERETKKSIQQVLDTREQIERTGIEVEVVSVGGTHNYEIVGAISGVTEVPAGTYALMDERYRRSRPQLMNAARLLTTVMSHPEPGRALLDTGQKSAAQDRGVGAIEGIPGATLWRMSAEHGFVDLEGDAQSLMAPKDKVWLVPYDSGDAANLFDYMHAVRGGRLEVVWEVAARGRYR